MVHAPHTKFHVISNVLTTGYDGNLAKGQLAFVKNTAKKGLGKQVIADFAGLTQKDVIAIEIGEATTPNKLRTVEVPYISTGLFPIGSIVDIKAYAPSNVTLKVDEFEIGYDGINDETALYIPEGKSAVMDIVVEGYVSSFFFGVDSHIIQKRVYRAKDETMQEVIQRLVKELNDDVVPSSIAWASANGKLSDLLEIGVVDSTAAPITDISYTFSTLTVTDNGDSNDLADIQAQYPLYKVVRTARIGSTSIYTILAPTGTVLSNYSKVTADVLGKTCEACLSGYDTKNAGYVYHISIEDDGSDLTSTIEGLITGETSVTKFGNKDGRGTYSVYIPSLLSDTAIAAIIVGRPEAEVSLVGDVVSVCSKTTTVSTAWVAGDSCTATTKEFSIVLKDDECGNSRLTELQAAYPDLTIIEGTYTGEASQRVTVSADTNLSIVVAGETYTTNDAGTTSQTADAWVTEHAADILAATGLTVTNPSANFIDFVGDAVGFPTITSAGQTVAAVVYETSTEGTTGGCKRTYSTKIITNIVCEECDDIYFQPFYAEAPLPYGSISWEEVVGEPNENALMGITVKGKPFYIYPETIEEDFIPFVETSLKIKSVSFGWREDDILNYTGEQYDVDLEFAKVVKVQDAQDVDNLSQSLFGAEDEGKLFGTNKTKYVKNLFARANFSQERILKYHKRMIKYVIEYRDQLLSQGGGSRSDITHGFGIIVEEGKHANLELILNKLAAKVGLEAVKASSI